MWDVSLVVQHTLDWGFAPNLHVDTHRCFEKKEFNPLFLVFCDDSVLAQSLHNP
jgi:hypothetical protein